MVLSCIAGNILHMLLCIEWNFIVCPTYGCNNQIEDNGRMLEQGFPWILHGNCSGVERNSSCISDKM